MVPIDNFYIRKCIIYLFRHMIYCSINYCCNDVHILHLAEKSSDISSDIIFFKIPSEHPGTYAVESHSKERQIT